MKSRDFFAILASVSIFTSTGAYGWLVRSEFILDQMKRETTANMDIRSLRGILPSVRSRPGGIFIEVAL